MKEFKLHNNVFNLVAAGVKTFDVRRKTDGIEQGEVFKYKAWDGSELLGPEITVKVSYIQFGGRFGVSKEMDIIGFKIYDSNRLRPVENT